MSFNYSTFTLSYVKRTNMGRISKRTVILLNIAAALAIIVLIITVTLKSLDSYTRHDENIKVPSFKEMPVEMAQKIAEGKKLLVTVTDSMYDADAKPGVIIDQYPVAGANVKRNRRIHVVINTMEITKVPMPHLINTAFRQSVNKLKSKGFNIGKIHYVASDYSNLAVGFIYGTDTVQSGDELPLGATIDILLGNGNRTLTQKVPDLRGKEGRAAADILLNLHFNTQLLDKDGYPLEEDEPQKAYIFKHYPETDSLVASGSTIMLYTIPDKDKVEELIRVADSLKMADTLGLLDPYPLHLDLEGQTPKDSTTL